MPEPIDEQVAATAEQSHFEVYPKKVHYPRRSLRDNGFDFTEHHWRFRDADGRIIAESGTGYSSPGEAERKIGVFLESLDAFDWAADVVKPPVVYMGDIDDA